MARGYGPYGALQLDISKKIWDKIINFAKFPASCHSLNSNWQQIYRTATKLLDHLPERSQSWHRIGVSWKVPLFHRKHTIFHFVLPFLRNLAVPNNNTLFGIFSW